jgi:hypothetical protein
MKKIFCLNNIYFLSVLIFLFGCGAMSNQVGYSFGYGDRGENNGLEILDYKYGDIDRASPQDVADHHIGQTGHIYGRYPLGDYLYVKWKDTRTGLIMEETADLKGKFPAHMEDKNLHFLIENGKLKIYVISDQLHGKEDSACPVLVYSEFNCKKIYPN